MSERDLACTQGHPADLRTDGVNKVNESCERAEVSRLVQSTKGESLRALSKYKTDLYGSPSACQQLKLGVVHTLPSKQSGELFVRGSERRLSYNFTTLPKKQLIIVSER